MANTTFVAQETRISSSWLNDINNFKYVLFDGAESASEARTAINAVDKSGDTMAGFLTLHSDPSSDMHAATKQYADSLVTRSIVTVSGTSATLSSTHANNYVYCTNAAAVTLTIPENTFDVGICIIAVQSGTGTVTFDPDTGVTLNTPSTLTPTSRERYSSISIVQVDTNVWVSLGDLAAV